MREFLIHRVVGAELGATSTTPVWLPMRWRWSSVSSPPGPPRSTDVPAPSRAWGRDESDLCRQLRDGEVDLRSSRVLDVICDGVIERVSIANPRYPVASAAMIRAG